MIAKAIRARRYEANEPDDPNETIAFHVLAASIWRHASAPVSVTPIKLNQVPMDRAREDLQSTEFSFSRFLVPWMCNYDGAALFMDCDMMVTDDIVKLFQQQSDRYAMQVIKHDYTPSTETKFLNQVQSRYKRKNWSSVMLFNNERCKALTPRAINHQSGMYLHQFEWLEDFEIGELAPEWGHLVGEYPWDLPYPPANIHWTLGGPYFDDYIDTDFNELWFAGFSINIIITLE